MKLKIVETFGMLPGFDTRSQQIGKTKAVSITGPYKFIAGAMKFALLFGLIAIEQIARFGIRSDGKNCHLVLIEDPEYQVTRKDAKQLAMLPDYSYAHQVSALDKGVNAGVFDQGFIPKTGTVGNAFAHFCSAIFAKGKVRGTETNTLLLLGRSAKDRVLVAYQWDNPDSRLTAIDQAIRGDVRFGCVQDTTLLVAAYGSNAYAALHVDQIAHMFETGEIPTWKTGVLPKGTKIEDFTPTIGNQATLVVTAKIGQDRKAVPANARWGKDNKTFQLQLVEGYATDLPETSAPIVRLTPKMVTTVNGNGLDVPAVLAVESIDAYGGPTTSQAMRRIAQDAESGAIWRAAA